MFKKETTPFSVGAVNGENTNLLKSYYQKTSFGVNSFPKGKIESGVLIKSVKRKNFFRALNAWGIARQTMEEALERGAELLELRIDDGEKLRVPLATAVQKGIVRQFAGFEEQVFVPVKFFSRADGSQMDLFAGEVTA